MKYAIEIKNLSKSYKLYKNKNQVLKELLFNKKCHKEKKVLNDISFNVKKGTIVGIVGRNGAGKSTLLKIISGITQGTGGSQVEINGKVSAILELNSGFDKELTGRENIYRKGLLMGIPKKEMQKNIKDIISFADIGEYIDQPIKTYSSGMQARLGFAIAANVNAEILIIDEAIAVGDTAFQLKCYQKFEEFKKQGKTILFVSHSLSAVITYCSEAILLENGKIECMGNPKQVVDYYKRILTTEDKPKGKFKDNKKEKVGASKRTKNHLANHEGYYEYGDKKVEILEYDILNSEGVSLDTIESNQYVEIKFKVRINEYVKQPIYAFSIKNLKGLELTGTNTLYEKIDVENFKGVGEEYTITFKQKICLRPGKYTLSLGCSEFIEGNLKVHHRLYDIKIFEVYSPKKIAHLFDSNSKIEIQGGKNE